LKTYYEKKIINWERKSCIKAKIFSMETRLWS